MMVESIPLAEVAHRLGQSWEKTWRQVLNGTLRGEKRGGRWIVEAKSVEDLVQRKAVSESREVTAA